MIPNNIVKTDVIKAIEFADKNGFPDEEENQYYELIFDGKTYPPKYILTLANEFANGNPHDPLSLDGEEYQMFRFLSDLGFYLVEKVDGDMTQA